MRKCAGRRHAVPRLLGPTSGCHSLSRRASCASFRHQSERSHGLPSGTSRGTRPARIFCNPPPFAALHCGKETLAMQDSSLKSAFYPLWITYAFVPIAAGFDKFTNLLVDWDKYIAPFALDLLPFSGQTFMYIVGVIEIGVGVLALTKF